jgi:hypothetical protein
MAEFAASINVRGLRELDAALRQLPEDVAGAIMADALAAGGDVVRVAAAGNIHSQTGKTAADIRVEVQNEPAKLQGAAGVGGTRRGRDGRAHVLRWLEFGTSDSKKGPIRAGAQDRRDARRAVRALRSIGDRAAASALRARILEGTGVRRALKLPGGIFRASATHHGIKGQSPLTRALAEAGDHAIKVFRDSLWRGIAKAANRLKGPAR